MSFYGGSFGASRWLFRRLIFVVSSFNGGVLRHFTVGHSSFHSGSFWVFFALRLFTGGFFGSFVISRYVLSSLHGGSFHGKFLRCFTVYFFYFTVGLSYFTVGLSWVFSLFRGVN